MNTLAWWEAAAWGMTGGGVAGLVQFSAAVSAAGFRFPWGDDREKIVPGLLVFVIALVVGAVVAAAMHGSLSGPWPALVMGLGAPATIRGLLAGVQADAKPSGVSPVDLVPRAPHHELNGAMDIPQDKVRRPNEPQSANAPPRTDDASERERR